MMARKCGMCDSLCLYFVLILRFTIVLCTIDKYYTYQPSFSQPRSIEGLEIQFLENNEQHNVQKRDVPISPAYVAVNTTKLDPKPTKMSTDIVSNLGTKPKQKSTKLPKAAEPEAKESSTEKHYKNLGEDGHGIRHINLNYTTTMPPLLHKKIFEHIIKNGTNSGPDFGAFPLADKDLNKTLAETNITQTREDSHSYYNSSFFNNITISDYWVDLDKMPNVITNDVLSSAHRRAATVKLSFDFPFYGNPIKNVTIATGGFLYTGDYVHAWLAATQYIAPLMANFDTSISNESFIRYVDNGTAFTVEWEKVALQDKPNSGEFTFQTTLYKSGDIVFVYKNVPEIIEKIQDDQHPVKVGVSDAYIIDRTVFFVRRKTIYEYHRVNFAKEDISNGTVIRLRPLPTCMMFNDCTSCLSETTLFKCRWCPMLKKCSNGMDRNRQDWLQKGCEKHQLSNESECSHIKGSDIFNESDPTYTHDADQFTHALENQERPRSGAYNDQVMLGPKPPKQMGMSGIVAILFLITLTLCLTWIIHAYRNPHTTSGQILIRYRPSSWRWRRGEARYTAATIHM